MLAASKSTNTTRTDKQNTRTGTKNMQRSRHASTMAHCSFSGTVQPLEKHGAERAQSRDKGSSEKHRNVQWCSVMHGWASPRQHLIWFPGRPLSPQRYQMRLRLGRAPVQWCLSLPGKSPCRTPCQRRLRA